MMMNAVREMNCRIMGSIYINIWLPLVWRRVPSSLIYTRRDQQVPTKATRNEMQWHRQQVQKVIVIFKAGGKRQPTLLHIWTRRGVTRAWAWLVVIETEAIAIEIVLPRDLSLHLKGVFSAVNALTRAHLDRLLYLDADAKKGLRGTKIVLN